MSRYNELCKRLAAGETVTYVEHGNSMSPRMKNGVTVTVAPCKLEDLKIGDVAFCKVNGAFYLHYVKAIGQDGRVQIGNAHGHVNGWSRRVFGRLTDFRNP
jgi:hypothetical protein